MSASLQHHGRSILDGFSIVEYRQGADCGELVSSTGQEEPGGEQTLSRRQQIGIALAVLVLIIGGGAAAVGGM